MEKLLQYTWKHRIFPLKSLQTTDGSDLEVIDPGMHNTDQGPDFFNAKINIGGTIWVGNVEVHLRASDWNLHHHNEDPRYNNTILHVVQEANAEVRTASGKVIPTIVLPIADSVRAHYQELCETDDFPRCHRLLPQLPPIKVHGWLDTLLAKRLEERAEKVLQRVKAMGGDWERATFATLSRNFGFGLNGDAFEKWAALVPLSAVNKHRDNLFQVESLFLGVSGLIHHLGISRDEAEVQRMEKEFIYLAHKFRIQRIMSRSDWSFLRTRPQCMPQVRLLQLARLYHEARASMSKLIETKSVDELRTLLRVNGLSVSSCHLLIINTVVPLLYAYGMTHHLPELQERAITLLQTLPAENNFILRQWESCGLNVQTAADSQALIELKRNYCDRKDCLRCRFAYEYLKNP